MAPKWAKCAQDLLLSWKGSVGLWQQAEWVMIVQYYMKEDSKKRVKGGEDKGLNGRNKHSKNETHNILSQILYWD